MSESILTNATPDVNITGIAPGVYRCGNTLYYGENIAEVTAQAIAEQSQPLPEVDWYVCDCGHTVDAGKTCDQCLDLPDIDFIEVGYNAYQENWLVINGRKYMDEPVVSIADDTIDIDDYMTRGLPATNYRTPRVALAEYGVMA